MSRLEPGDVLSVEQARAIFPIPRSTFYDLLRSRQIPAIEQPTAGGGRRYLILARDLDAYILSLRSTPTAPAARETVDDILARTEKP